MQQGLSLTEHALLKSWVNMQSLDCLLAPSEHLTLCIVMSMKSLPEGLVTNQPDIWELLLVFSKPVKNVWNLNVFEVVNFYSCILK